MAMTLVVQLRPKDVEEFITWAKTMLSETRASDGCEFVTLHRDSTDAGRVVLLERWTSAQHQESYAASRAEQGAAADIQSLLAESPAVQVLTDIDV